MWFSIYWSTSFTRKSIISLYYFPFSINEQFYRIVIRRILIEQKLLCNKLRIYGYNRCNTTQEIAISNGSLNDIFRLYLPSNTYSTHLSYQHRRSHLKHIEFICFEYLCWCHISSLRCCWIVIINVPFVLSEKLLHLLHIYVLGRGWLTLAIVSHCVGIGNMAITKSLIHLWSLLGLYLEFLLLAGTIFMGWWIDVLLHIRILLRGLYLLNWLRDFYRGDFFWIVKWIHFGFIFEDLNSPWFLSDLNFEEVTELLYCYVLVWLEIVVDMLDNSSTNFPSRKLFNICS